MAAAAADAAATMDLRSGMRRHFFSEAPKPASPGSSVHVHFFRMWACAHASCHAVQVADWVTFIGLDQYRRKFVHHAISSALLLELGSTQLKVHVPVHFLKLPRSGTPRFMHAMSCLLPLPQADMGIYSVGHRRQLCDAIARLRTISAGSVVPPAADISGSSTAAHTRVFINTPEAAPAGAPGEQLATGKTAARSAPAVRSCAHPLGRRAVCPWQKLAAS